MLLKKAKLKITSGWFYSEQNFNEKFFPQTLKGRNKSEYLGIKCFNIDSHPLRVVLTKKNVVVCRIYKMLV